MESEIKRRAKMDKFKKTLTIVSAVVLSVALTACSAKTIEIPMFDGTTIEVETKDMSKEQIQALEQIESGDSNIMSLMQSGLFTVEELTELGLNAGGRMPGGMQSEMQGGIIQDFSSVNISDLNLDGLSDDQINSIKSLIAGETTMQEVLSSGMLTQEQLSNSGLIAGTRQGQTPGGGRQGTNQQTPDNANGN